MGSYARGVKPSLDGEPICSCAGNMNLRLPFSLALASCALFVLDGCGPKHRGPKPGGGEETSEGGGEKKNLDKFDAQVAYVRENFPKAPQGSAVVVRFYNATKDIKLSLIYFDKDAPEFKPKSGSHLVLALAKNDTGELLSTLSILHKNWQPGHYACGDDTLIGFSLSASWNPAAPDTYGSWNAGGGCEFELHPAQTPGDLEGSFRGVFVQNDGSGKLTIQDGYLYVKAFQSGAM